MERTSNSDQEHMASLGRLAAGVAHEINNPLGYMRANIETLADYTETLIDLVSRFRAACDKLTVSGEFPQDDLAAITRIWNEEDVPFIMDDASGMLRETLEGADRASWILSAVKSYAQGETSATEPVDLNSCARTALMVVNNELKYHCTVEADLSDGLMVEANFGALTQVIAGILVNAGEAVDGRGEVTVRSGMADREAWLSVADTGTGMQPEVASRAFEPGFSTKGDSAPKGLPLSACRTAVERYGGRLDLETTPGNGTTVKVVFPARA